MIATKQQYAEFAKLAEQIPVWYWFQEISNIPRGSYHEEQICQYIIEFAKARNLPYTQDDAGNIVIKKPAQNGGSNNIVSIQGHVDMVWQKTDDSDFDFFTQPIRPYVDGEWVTAGETTLGADNGIGVAYILAVLDNKEMVHPNIEAILTTGEEVALIGALAMDTSMLESTMMINTDSGSFGKITVGCMGALDMSIGFEYSTQNITDDYLPYTITVEGLKGGHSGSDINKGRQNANKLMVRILRYLSNNNDFYLQSIYSDYPTNVIPRLCNSVIFVQKSEQEKLQRSLNDLLPVLDKELQTAEPNLNIILKAGGANGNSVVAKEQQDKILYTFNALPNGVYKHSSVNPAMVETSSNISAIDLKDGKCVAGLLQRAVNTISKHDLAEKIIDTFKINNFNNLQVEFITEYVGWQPDYDSVLVAKAVESYQKLFNIQPLVSTSQGGLECGIIDSAGVMDKVAIGPDMTGLHSPMERVKTKTVTDVEMVLHDLLAKI